MHQGIGYLVGDATHPDATGNKVIVHVCNDIGGWGKGFVMALSKRWLNPAAEYRTWYKSQDGFELGAVQMEIESGTANAYRSALESRPELANDYQWHVEFAKTLTGKLAYPPVTDDGDGRRLFPGAAAVR